MNGKLVWLILGLAFILRIAFFNSYPTGFNADEASFGYDAYSLLKTGKDQWGNSWPIVFRSFGDNKSPLYGYLTIPSIFLFGLTKFATRLPNVIIGTVSVLVVYLLVKKLVNSKTAALVSSLLMAISPWSIMLSRVAAESNLITLFLPLGIYFFLEGLEKPKMMNYAAFFLGLNLFTYHSAKLITPFVIALLVLFYWKKIHKLKLINIIAPILLFSIFFIGFIYTFKLGGGTRIVERSIMQGALEEGAEQKIRLIQQGKDPFVSRLFHNKYQVVAARFANNYRQYFSYKFLFVNGVGDGSYGMIPGIGVSNILEGFLALGIIPLFYLQKSQRKLLLFLLFWILIAVLPAALSTGSGYAGNRASGMVPAMQIVGGVGFLGWSIFLHRYKMSTGKVAMAIFVLIVCSTVYQFVDAYFKTPLNLIQRQMLSGSLEVAGWLNDNANGKNILISRSISEPQIFVAFTAKWDPSEYQNSTKSWGYDPTKTTWIDQLPKYSLGNYIFKSIDDEDFVTENAFVVVRADEYKGLLVPTKIINYADGEPNIYVLDTSLKSYAKAI